LHDQALGNHEFDRGLPTLQSFINNISSEVDILSSNIDNSKEPGLTGYKPYVIKELNGTKVGIIGFTTDDTPMLAGAGKWNG